MSYHIRSTCRLCDAALPDERVLDLGETPLANALIPRFTSVSPRIDDGGIDVRKAAEEPRYPLYLKACPACGHVQLPVVVDPKLLFPADYPYCSSTGAGMREHLESLARDVGSPLGGDAFAVDIGSNDGYLLKCLRHHGLRAVGVDPALTLATSATERGDLTVPAFFNRQTAWAIRHACGQAQFITALNVFAHADDLHEIVEGVKVLLAPEGRFVFEVGYLPDVLRANNFGTVYHEHLSYHSLRPLEDLFERHKMQIYDAHRVDTQGGSLRCYVQNGFRGYSRQMERLRSEEFGALRGLKDWQSRVKQAADALTMSLTSKAYYGKKIAAYGCSAKSTTLLHVAGIGRETIDFICDDAPTKQGKFSPGKHIPVVPGSWLEEKQPDYCISLAGNFSEAFKAAHPLYRGTWIEPDLTGTA